MAPSWSSWGERLNAFLVKAWDKLTVKRGDERPADDGIIMWDRDSAHAVVSADGVFKPLSYGYNMYGAFYDTTDQTPAAINTAYALTWNSTAASNGIAIGTPTSRIVFERTGRFHIDFTVQITSGSSSAKNTWFWPRINGVDVPNSTMKTTLLSNGETMVTSRAAIFSITAGDYLEAYWAADSTNLTVESIPATAFAPATPSITLMITEINGA